MVDLSQLYSNTFLKIIKYKHSLPIDSSTPVKTNISERKSKNKYGETEVKVIGTRHGEKLYETLVTREEMAKAIDMGGYYRIPCDNRDLNYDKFVVNGEVHTMADEAYTSHNTIRLDVEGTVKKILTTDYVREELNGISHN